LISSGRGVRSRRAALLLGLGAFLIASLLCQMASPAESISAKLSIEYFEVGVQANPPDFGGSGRPNVALGSSLGPDALPMASSPPGISDVDPNTNQITWWSPTLNKAVVATGLGTVSLPYASNMYPPNSIGQNDSAFFETAILRGQFSLSASQKVTFQVGSDDDSFVYVDGTLIGQNPGIHGVTNVEFTSNTLAPGPHNVVVFYADREQSGPYLSLNLLTPGVVITPTSTIRPILPQYAIDQLVTITEVFVVGVIGWWVVIGLKVYQASVFIPGHVSAGHLVQLPTYPVGLIRLFGLGVCAFAFGLVILVAFAIFGVIEEFYPATLAASVLLAGGMVTVALSLLRGQDIEEQSLAEVMVAAAPSPGQDIEEQS
jgi:hypothetical protein